MNDLELLRRHEPIVCFTAGELFLPCAVDEYVGSSSLWLRSPDGQTRELVPHGALDLTTLVAQSAIPAEHSLYLRFVDEPLSALDYQHWSQRPDQVPFRAASRLARVPLLSRLLAAGFDLSLLIRGTVPGGTAAAAEVLCRDLTRRDDRLVYYGRVLRDGGWIVLQYLFFYAMNNWRSGFHGVNDHEADWEQIFVYLYERSDDVTPEPRWVAYASHDYQGDDLRRRWDDPLLQKEGAHPVVFAGAGSHASYFEQGEYVMGVEPGFLAPLKRAMIATRKFWVETLGQGSGTTASKNVSTPVSIPFVDYARGDGVRIGPGADRAWSPIVISDADPWVARYRGLWGLDTRDFFGGERAPSGPKYNRDGSVRLSWSDPLGWAGLDKVLPPPEVPLELAARQQDVAQEIAGRAVEIQEQRQIVRELGLDAAALRTTAYHSTIHAQKAQELAAAEGALRRLQTTQLAAEETHAALQAYRERVQSGIEEDPQAHLHHIHRAVPPLPPQRIAIHIWGAISSAIALLAIVALLAFTPPQWWLWAIFIAIAFMVIEATTRGRVMDFLLNTVIVLALITTLILVREYWRVLVIIGLVGIVLHMVRENLRELASR